MKRNNFKVVGLVVLFCILLGATFWEYKNFDGHSSVYSSSTVQIDEYFSKDANHVYYLSLEAPEFDAPVSTTTKVVIGADPATFKRISDFEHHTSPEGGTDYAYYQDKNNTYEFSYYRGLGGVDTTVKVINPSDMLPPGSDH